MCGTLIRVNKRRSTSNGVAGVVYSDSRVLLEEKKISFREEESDRGQWVPMAQAIKMILLCWSEPSQRVLRQYEDKEYWKRK